MNVITVQGFECSKFHSWSTLEEILKFRELGEG